MHNEQTDFGRPKAFRRAEKLLGGLRMVCSGVFAVYEERLGNALPSLLTFVNRRLLAMASVRGHACKVAKLEDVHSMIYEYTLMHGSVCI